MYDVQGRLKGLGKLWKKASYYWESEINGFLRGKEHDKCGGQGCVEAEEIIWLLNMKCFFPCNNLPTSTSVYSYLFHSLQQFLTFLPPYPYWRCFGVLVKPLRAPNDFSKSAGSSIPVKSMFSRNFNKCLTYLSFC